MVSTGVFVAPKLSPNENDDAGFVAEVVVVTGLASLALVTGGVEVDSEANEKLVAGVALLESFELERFSEKPLLFASSADKEPAKPDDPPKMEFEVAVVVPNPANTVADVTAGELPKPAKTEVVEGVADREVESVEFADLDPLLSFSEPLVENGLAVDEGSPKENPFVESPEPGSSVEKFGVPVGALMVTTGESSFFSGSLKVNEAFSLLDGGLFSSCFFSAAFDGSLCTKDEALFEGSENEAETVTFALAIVEEGFGVSGVCLVADEEPNVSGG